MSTKTKHERDIALGAARGLFRKRGEFPEDKTAKQALALLDDLYRKDSHLLAAIWYRSASDSQIALFIRDWNDWCKMRMYENKYFPKTDNTED